MFEAISDKTSFFVLDCVCCNFLVRPLPFSRCVYYSSLLSVGSRAYDHEERNIWRRGAKYTPGGSTQHSIVVHPSHLGRMGELAPGSDWKHNVKRLKMFL